jgi:hypothetical protein
LFIFCLLITRFLQQDNAASLAKAALVLCRSATSLHARCWFNGRNAFAVFGWFLPNLFADVFAVRTVDAVHLADMYITAVMYMFGRRNMYYGSTILVAVFLSQFLRLVRLGEGLSVLRHRWLSYLSKSFSDLFCSLHSQPLFLKKGSKQGRSGEQ